MAIGDSYADTAALKGRLRITDTTDDDRLTEALSVASRGIEDCTNRQFNDAGAATARVFFVDSPMVAKVDDFSTTTGLIIATDPARDGGFATVWAASSYQLEPLNGTHNGVTGWPYWRIRATSTRFPSCEHRALLRVTARWGWTAVPKPVREATLILAEELFKLRDTPFGMGGYGEYGRIRAKENPHVWMRIAPYRRDAVIVG